MHFAPEQIEQVAIAELVPYKHNARTHSDEQIAQIAASIGEFGWTTPLLIDGENIVIAGHARLRAANLLKLSSVPCIRLAHLTVEQRRALTIADNRIPLNSGWSEELLAFELDELRAMSFDLSLLGFPRQELNDLIGTPATVDMPELPAGDKGPVQQMSFMLTQEQADLVERALALVQTLGPIAGLNNRNAYALARVCELFLLDHDGQR